MFFLSELGRHKWSRLWFQVIYLPWTHSFSYGLFPLLVAKPLPLSITCHWARIMNAGNAWESTLVPKMLQLWFTEASASQAASGAPETCWRYLCALPNRQSAMLYFGGHWFRNLTALDFCPAQDGGSAEAGMLRLCLNQLTGMWGKKLFQLMEWMWFGLNTFKSFKYRVWLRRIGFVAPWTQFHSREWGK